MNTMTLAGVHRDTSCSDDNAETVNMFHEYTLSLRQPHDVHQGARHFRLEVPHPPEASLWDTAFKIGNGGGRKELVRGRTCARRNPHRALTGKPGERPVSLA